MGIKKNRAFIVCEALQKGGTGKTTTTVSLAVYLAKVGYRVAILDFDSQGNSSISCGIDPDELDKTIYNVFTGECDIKDVIIHTKYEVDIIPSNDDLANFDMFLVENKEVIIKELGSIAKVLLNELQSIIYDYDYIFIDLPPSLNLQTINALTASDGVIIPMQCEYLATKGVLKMLKTIKKIQDMYNPNLKVLGIVGTMYVKGTNQSSIVLQQLRQFGENQNIKVFNTVIRRSVRLGEAPMFGVPSILYSPESDAIKDYIQLAEEVFGNEI